MTAIPDLHLDLSRLLAAALGVDAVWRTWQCPRCHAESARREGCAACIRRDLADLLGLPDSVRDPWLRSEEHDRYLDGDELVPRLVHGIHDFPDWHPEWSLTPHAPVDWEAPEILVPRWERWVSATGIHVATTFGWTPDGVCATLVIDDVATTGEGASLTAAWAAAWLGTLGPGNAE